MSRPAVSAVQDHSELRSWIRDERFWLAYLQSSSALRLFEIVRDAIAFRVTTTE